MGEIFALLRGAWKQATPRALLVSLLLVLAAGLAACHFDQAIAATASDGDHPGRRLAEWFSFWGDFLPGTVPLTLVLIGLGWALKKPAWRHAGLAALPAAAIAGGCVSSFRLTLGRPRPYGTVAEAQERLHHVPQPWLSFHRPVVPGHLPDGFYGPQRPAMFQGFPSGHAATSVATAAALAVALPPVGIPACAIAAGVCWSRYDLRRHYFSDIFVGGFVGLIVGIRFGRAARHPIA